METRSVYRSQEVPSNVDYRLLVRRKQRERAILREIGRHGTNAFLIMLLGVGAAVLFGGLVLTFGILYVINMFVRIII